MMKELTAGELCIVLESLEDAENIYEYMGCDPEMTRYTGWNPYQSLEATIEKIQRDLGEENCYSWVIKKDGEFVGTIGAYDYQPEDGSIEIGYSIARKDWGKGYATLAAKAVVEFLMQQPQVKKVRAWSHEENVASRKVLMAAGLKEIGKDGEQVTFCLE